MSLVCAVEPCQYAAGSKGLCQDHYAEDLERRLVDKRAEWSRPKPKPKPRPKPKGGPCLYCENEKQTPIVKGLCQLHYDRARKGLDMHAPKYAHGRK